MRQAFNFKFQINDLSESEWLATYLPSVRWMSTLTPILSNDMSAIPTKTWGNDENYCLFFMSSSLNMINITRSSVVYWNNRLRMRCFKCLRMSVSIDTRSAVRLRAHRQKRDKADDSLDRVWSYFRKKYSCCGCCLFYDWYYCPLAKYKISAWEQAPALAIHFRFTTVIATWNTDGNARIIYEWKTRW